MIKRKLVGLIAMATVVVATAGGCTNYDEDLRLSVRGALALAHQRSLACAQELLRGNVDGGDVGGSEAVWTDCFSKDPQTGEDGETLVKRGSQLRGGSWLIGLTGTGRIAQVEVIDVGEAQVDRSAAGPMSAIRAQCWTATIDFGSQSIGRITHVPCPADAVHTPGGKIIENDDFVTQFAEES